MAENVWRKLGSMLMRFRGVASDPSDAADLDVWFRSDANNLRMRRDSVNYWVTQGNSGNTVWYALTREAGAGLATETTFGTTRIIQFDAAAVETWYYAIKIPEWYTNGNVTIKMQWCNDTVQVGVLKAVWQVSYIGLTVSSNAAAGLTSLAAITVTLANNQAAKTLMTTNLGAIPSATVTGNKWIGIRLQRLATDVNDTMTGDGFVTALWPQVV